MVIIPHLGHFPRNENVKENGKGNVLTCDDGKEEQVEAATECSPPSFLAIPNHLDDQQLQELTFDPRFGLLTPFLKFLTFLLSCWIFHFQLSCGPGQTPATDGRIDNVKNHKM